MPRPARRRPHPALGARRATLAASAAAFIGLGSGMALSARSNRAEPTSIAHATVTGDSATTDTSDAVAAQGDQSAWAATAGSTSASTTGAAVTSHTTTHGS